MPTQTCRRQRHQSIWRCQTSGESLVEQWIHASLALRPDLDENANIRRPTLMKSLSIKLNINAPKSKTGSFWCSHNFMVTKQNILIDASILILVYTITHMDSLKTYFKTYTPNHMYFLYYFKPSKSFQG